MQYPVAVVSDWDADGVVSAAEIVYSQEFLGIYPLKERSRVYLIPASPRTFIDAVNEAKSVKPKVVVVLDIAYSKSVDQGLRELRSSTEKIIYIDHHLSTAIHSSKIEPLVDELVVGKVPTALLVAHIIKSLGGKLSIRLEAFTFATSIVERGIDSRRAREKRRGLIKLVVDVSKALTITKDRNLWEKLVRWLSSPIAFVAMPFTQSLESIVGRARLYDEDKVKALANELALSAIKVFDLKIVDVRKKKLDVKLTVLASHLHKLFRSPVIIVGKSRTEHDMIIVRAKGDLPYRLALKLYEEGIVKELAGHQSLAIIVFKNEIDVQDLANKIRRILLYSLR